MSSTRYETFSRFKSRTMVALCVLFTIIILVMLGLVTGFLTVKGYRGMLGRPRLIHGTIAAITDKSVTISGVSDESGATAERTFNDGSGTIINIDSQGATSSELAVGMTAYLRYSTTDPDQAVYIGVVGKIIEGTVSSVEVADDDTPFSGTLTLDRSDGTTVNYRIRKTVAISVNGESTLAKLPDRTRVRVQLSARDEKRVLAIASVTSAVANAAPATDSILPPIIGEDAILSQLEPKYPGGLRNGIVGTLILIALASIVGIPVGMLTGVFLAEYSSGSRLASPVRFVADVLTGVPSIVVGILGYELLVRPLRYLTLPVAFNRILDPLLLHLHVPSWFVLKSWGGGLGFKWLDWIVVYFGLNWLDWIVIFLGLASILTRGLARQSPGARLGAIVCLGFTALYGLLRVVLAMFDPTGFNGWAGALALAFIMIPLVARTTEEMLLLVPRSYREASVALGATKSRTILKVVLPAAAGSVITGIMLAIARVAGETAPLLFTVAGFDALELNPNKQFPALTLQIFKYSQTSDTQQNNLAWSGILILLILIFVLNVVVRVTAKAMSKGKSAT